MTSKANLCFLGLALVFCQAFGELSSNCIGTCYVGDVLPNKQNIHIGKQLKGHAYKNITTNDKVQCYSSCVQDCRCKACQMKDTACELLDEDKQSKTLTDDSKSVYFDLDQKVYHGKESHMVAQGGCYNGCCRSNPCLNGGTCVEHCTSPKEKFTCKCIKNFIGNVCQIKETRSCLDILRSAKERGFTPENKVYNILTQQGFEKVYCDFKTPGIAWSLIESFSFNNNRHYKKKAMNQANPRNKDSPTNFKDHRITQEFVLYIHQTSTMFRATCDFPVRTSLKPDLVIGYLKDFDIITKGDLRQPDGKDGECMTYSYVNIRGHEFHNVSIQTFQRQNAHHLHLGYPLNQNLCGFKPISGAVNGEGCFGFYNNYHKDFTCTKTGDSTTQWWLGARL